MSKVHISLLQFLPPQQCFFFFQLSVFKSKSVNHPQLPQRLSIIYKLGYLKKDCTPINSSQQFCFVMRSSCTKFFVLFKSVVMALHSHKCFREFPYLWYIMYIVHLIVGKITKLNSLCLLNIVCMHRKSSNLVFQLRRQSLRNL